MHWKTRKFLRTYLQDAKRCREMWGSEARSLLSSRSSACVNLKKGTRRDGVVKHAILVVRLWLWSSERAGKLLHAAALCLMS